MSQTALRSGVVLALAALAGIQVGQRINRPPAAPVATPIEARKAGDSVPDLFLHSVGATPRAVPFASAVNAEGCTILYFFDPQCPACREGAPEWAIWTERQPQAAGGPSVLWVNTGDPDSLRAFLATLEPPPGNVLAVREDNPAFELGIAGVPTAWAVRRSQIVHVSMGLILAAPPSSPSDWCDA